jgi:hypothetical protein
LSYGRISVLFQQSGVNIHKNAPKKQALFSGPLKFSLFLPECGGFAAFLRKGEGT